MEAQITSLVARVILDNTGRCVELGAEDPLIQSGYLDSMTLVSLVISLQDEFGVRLELADMSAENFATVRAITALLRARIGG